MNAPKVFVSHASENKDRFVNEFAHRLRSKGIDAWLDKWEIQPGDSLVKKLFDEGIANAQAVIIVISQHSIIKPWVRKELDESVVRQVVEGTRLIPVLLDECEVPAPLRDTIWEKIGNLTDYDSEFDRIVQTIYGHSVKPPLGSPPEYVQGNVANVSGLNPIDTLVLKTASEEVIRDGNRIVMVNSLVETLTPCGINQEQVEESVEILISDQYFASASPSFRYFTLTKFGFHEHLRLFYPDYDLVTVRVAFTLVNEGVNVVDTVAEKLGCPKAIVGHIFDVFETKGFLKQIKPLGMPNQAHTISPRLRRWLSEQTVKPQ